MNRKVTPHSLRFRLTLSAEKYMAYYEGKAQYIAVRSIDNKSVKFAANAIRKFLMHDGIYGLFEIQYDENNKLIDIERINE